VTVIRLNINEVSLVLILVYNPTGKIMELLEMELGKNSAGQCLMNITAKAIT
jgi:hypothetical protein